jgi:hypothetical protein
LCTSSAPSSLANPQIQASATERLVVALTIAASLRHLSVDSINSTGHTLTVVWNFCLTSQGISASD